MDIHTCTNRLNIQRPVVTIGTFDGLHKGHVRILENLKQAATEQNGETVVITFWPHPRWIVDHEEYDLKLLNTLEEKKELLEKENIDHLVIIPFNEHFSKITSIQFIDNIHSCINIKHLIIGPDHQFGKDRGGNFDTWKTYAEEHHFIVEKISLSAIEKTKISSTKIRRALLSGNIKKANKYLGYSYFLTGNVKEGKKIGQQIGFPTANIHIEEPYKLIPKTGVYASEILINGKRYKGMLNIGVQPTIHKHQKEDISVEVNIFDFNENIYNREIRVRLIEKIRDEKKFNTIDDLKTQLHKDKDHVIKLFSS